MTRAALKPEAANLPGHAEAAMRTPQDRMNIYEDGDLRSQILRFGKAFFLHRIPPFSHNTGINYSHTNLYKCLSLEDE